VHQLENEVLDIADARCNHEVYLPTYLPTYPHNCHPATLYNLRTNCLLAYLLTNLTSWEISILKQLAKNTFLNLFF